MSAQLKLINSLPLIYWEPEQDVVYAEVAGQDFYYNLLTIKLNAFPSLPQKLGQKFVSIWHYMPPNFRPKTLDGILNS